MSAAQVIQIHPDDAAARAAAAEIKLSELREAAHQADAELAAAQATFDGAPSAQTYDPIPALERAAVIARKQVEVFEAETAALISSVRRSAMRAELDEIMRVHSRSGFTPQRERIADTLASFQRDIRGSVVDLLDALVAHNQRLRRAQVLADGLGMSERFALANIDDVLAGIVSKLQTETTSIDLRLNNPTGDTSRELLVCGVTMPARGQR